MNRQLLGMASNLRSKHRRRLIDRRRVTIEELRADLPQRRRPERQLTLDFVIAEPADGAGAPSQL